jgi:hypothetical protein
VAAQDGGTCRRGAVCSGHQSVVSRSVLRLPCTVTGHAQGVALLQQTSPFKGKTCPIPIDSSTSPCHQQSAILRDRTFPRPKYESPVFGQNHVRRLQRSSKERSHIHSVCEESPPQAGQWTIIRVDLAAYADNQKASRLTSLRGYVPRWHCDGHSLIPSLQHSNVALAPAIQFLSVVS